MVKADQIPDEVWHTAMSTYHKIIKKRPGSAWQEAIAAGLAAWPGTFEEYMNNEDGDGASLCVILPQEAHDE